MMPSDTQSTRVTDAAVVQRRARVNGHHVRLGRVADACRHLAPSGRLQQRALVKARAADQKVVGRPFAALVLAPGLAQPFAMLDSKPPLASTQARASMRFDAARRR
jgi:hypothetical protein